MKLKRTTLLISALMAMSLAACGPKSNNESSSSEQISINTSEIAESSVEEASSVVESSSSKSEATSSSESMASSSSETSSSSVSSSSSETTPVNPGGDKGGKLKFGPPWDFDNSYMGSTNSTTFYHILNDLYKNYTWFSTAVKAKIKEYLKDDGLVSQVWNATKAEAETHRSAVEEREYVKWRDEKYGYTCLGTQYASFTAALNGLNDWLVSHKSWIGSSYNIDFNS